MTTKKPLKTGGRDSKLGTKSDFFTPVPHHYTKNLKLIRKQICLPILIVPQPKPISILYHCDCGNPGYRVWGKVHICCRRNGIK
jgi:hypothetical protein